MALLFLAFLHRRRLHQVLHALIGGRGAVTFYLVMALVWLLFGWLFQPRHPLLSNCYLVGAVVYLVLAAGLAWPARPTGAPAPAPWPGRPPRPRATV